MSKPKPKVKDLINPKSPSAKILPYPFNPEVITEDGVFVRIYYNNGEFNSNEVIAESQLHIDIICATDLWLIDNCRDKNNTEEIKNADSLIRAYDIAGRVIDLVGRRSINPYGLRLNFSSYQHMYINAKYHCIRLYADYMSVES